MTEAVIRRRKAVANATANGLAVAEMAPRDTKACEEIEQLVSNVFNVMEIAYGNYTPSRRSRADDFATGAPYAKPAPLRGKRQMLTFSRPRSSLA